MAKKEKEAYMNPEDDPRYHDTLKLLKEYRDASYSLKVVTRQLEEQFRLRYGTTIDEFLESADAAGIDLSKGDIAGRARSIERSNQMLKLLESSVDILRENHKYGEEYYWILYYAFLSPHEFRNAEEILEKLEGHIPYISYRTYYRKRKAAIHALSSVLWGFTARETVDILDEFFPEE